MKYSAYPKYKSSGVEWLGNVPEHWEVKRLKGIGYFKAGTGFPDSEQGNEDEELPFFKVADMNNDGNDVYMNSSNNTVSRLTAKKLGAHIFKKNTVTFAKVGAALLLNRRRIIARDSCFDNNTMGYIIDKADHKYIFYWLYPIDFGRLSNPGAVPSINDGQLREIPIAIPPLPEQQAIATFLDREMGRIDSLIGKKQRFIELLKEKRMALISHAVTKGLNPKAKMKPSGVEWLGDVPEHWAVKRMKHLGVIRYGLGEPPEYVDDGLPFIRATDIKRGKVEMDLVKKIRPEDVPWSRNPQLKHNEILVVRSGAYTGDSAIIASAVVDCIAGYDMVYTAHKAHAPFMAWVLLSKYMLNGQIYFKRMRAAQPHLNAEELGNFTVLLPPFPEQKAIADFLDRETSKIDSLVAKVETVIEKLKEYRTALISAAVTGKIDVSSDVR